MAFNLPTDPSTAEDYSLWRKDAVIWQKLTSVPKAKQGLALQYACKSKPRVHEAVVSIASEEVECDQGFENVLKVLDNLFKTDKKEEEMKAYYDFEKISRSDGQSIADFINQFDSVLNKTKAHGNQMNNNLLAIKLMRASNLTKTQCDILKGSTAETDYESIKTSMKRIFGESTGLQSDSYSGACAAQIKTEPTFHLTSGDNSYATEEGHQSSLDIDTPEDIFYNRNKQGKYSFNKNTKKETVPGTKFMFGKNPLDAQGRLTRCSICDSVNHWKSRCPDRDSTAPKNNYYNIVLYQADLDDPQNINSLVKETIGAAVADCGAANTCTGQNWLNLYLDLLSKEDRELVSYSSSSKSYKFGAGPIQKALSLVKFPIYLGSKKVLLEADILKQDLPLLLSKTTMKKACAKLNTETDEINMLGENIKLLNTSTGHYAIPLTPNKNLINHFNEIPSASVPDKIVLLSSKPHLSISEVATKLHRQFAHPPSDRLIRLLNRSEHKDNQELKVEIKNVTDTCDICRRFKRTPSRPVVSLPLSSEFNELVAMDIKFYQGVPLLHLIDSCTRYSVAAVLKSKQSKEVIDSIFKFWISIFGRPQKIITDNGGEFVSDDFRRMAESMGIFVTTTAAESPWSNGLCERYNQVIGDSIDKILTDVDCSLTVALAWAVNAKNSLANVHGFSPAQLVFGFNPILPSVLSDRPPALSNNDYAEIISNHLQAQKLSREAFIQAESSERIRRALSHNIRSSGDIKYLNGDKVYFKRNDSKKWSGPAVVIGQDGQFVLLRHQSTWIRVHPCRLQLLDAENMQIKAKDDTTKDDNTLNQEFDSNNSSQADTGVDQVDEDMHIIEEPVQNESEVQPNHTSDENIAQIDTEDSETPPNQDNALSNDLAMPDLTEESQIQSEDLDIEGQSNQRIELENARQEETDTNQNNQTLNSITDVQKSVKNPYNKAKKFTNILKPGAEIKFKATPDDDWQICSILSRSGTVRGKYPNEWNVRLNDIIQQIDFDRDVLIAEPYTSNENNDVPVQNTTTNLFFSSIPVQHMKDNEFDTEFAISRIFSSEVEDMTREAKLKELDEWKVKEVYEEVERDEKLPLMSLKWVVKPKLIDGVQKMKARLVARGDLEKENFRSDSPTCSKVTIRLILVFITTMKQKICSWDVKTAFLNNDNLTRDIYVRPPKEAQTSKLWKLRKTIYGLRDASRSWYLKLTEKLILQGCTKSSIDPAFFYRKNLHTGVLEGVIGIYVDDLLHAGIAEFKKTVMKDIEGLFIIGSQHQDMFTYIGLELEQQEDFGIDLHITKYIDKLKEISTSHYDLPAESKIPEDLKTPVRSLVGMFNWACSVSRPDIAYYACQFSSKACNATLRDIQDMNKVVRYLKTNPVVLRFPPFSGFSELILEVYCDAAYGNLAGGASQGGYVILVSDGVVRTPVSWSSHKLKRVSRSTLTAETLALADAIDAAIYISALMSEVIYDSGKSVPIVCYTDNDSLYQAAHTSNVVDEKRLRIELGAIRESIDRNEFILKWVSSKDQVADALTKAGVSTRKLKEVMC